MCKRKIACLHVDLCEGTDMLGFVTAPELQLSAPNLRVGQWDLARDLAQLERVLSVGADEAAVIYCGRILDVVSAHAASLATGESALQSYSNLTRLADLGLLAPGTAALLHALRRLANCVRHAASSLAPPDTAVALVLLERLLNWYFTRCLVGPRDLGVRLVEFSLGDDSLRQLLQLLDDDHPPLDELAQHWKSQNVWMVSPVPGALYAERLLAVRDLPNALSILSTMLDSFPGDIRLRQLQALGLRVQGRLDEALAQLETLNGEAPNDPETLGILGGTMKRLWVVDERWQNLPRGRQDVLIQAARIYYDAWCRSGRSHTYTGINAASLALVTGKTKRSREIAGRILQLFEGRQRLSLRVAVMPFSDYWDRVTHAEAMLLLGRVDLARIEYRNAMAVYADRPRDIESTREQLTWLLPALNFGGTLATFLDEMPPRPTIGLQEESPPMTYLPRPFDTKGIKLTDDLLELLERLAEHNHDVWATQRIADGWIYGKKRDDGKKEHPDLIAYSELTEEEKVYDRNSVRTTLQAILAMGYRIVR